MNQPENTYAPDERFPLEKLVKQAFARLSCPSLSNGLYAELEKLVQQAYNMGRDITPVTAYSSNDQQGVNA